MNKLVGFVLGAALVAGAGYGGWWVLEESGWLALRPGAPHPDNLRAGVERHLLRQVDRRPYQCISIGYRPTSSVAGQSAFPETRFDFNPTAFRIVDLPNAVQGRGTAAPRLQFLARHGLLEAKPAADGGTEYTMTWKGFAQSNDNGCFAPFSGRPQAELISSSRKPREGIEYFEVVARVSHGALPDWAGDSAFATVFGPEAARLLERKPVVFELIRDAGGFTVVSENGAAVREGGRVDPSIVAHNARRVGTIDAERIRTELQAQLEGNMAPQARLCLPVPAHAEADETDFHTSSTRSGATVQKTAASFTFYNLIGQTGGARTSVMRGYAQMRKLETLGLARSEQLPASEFRGAPAAGAVRFVMEGPVVEAVINSPTRCFLAGRLVVDEVLSFEQVEEWRTWIQFRARLKVEPAGELGEKAMQAYGHFKRMAEAGVGLRYNLRITGDGLRFSGGALKLAAFDPDVSGLALPVVVGERAPAPTAAAPRAEVPVKVILRPIMEMSRISGDGLTMTFGGAGPVAYAKSSVARGQGKWYAEATLKTRPGARAPDTYTSVGVARNPARDIEFLTHVPRAPAFQARTSSDLPADGEVIGIAFDADIGKAYFFRSGRWTSGPPDNPNAGLRIAKSVEYVVYAASSASSGTVLGRDAWTLNFGASRFRYPIPAGYLSWDARVGGPGVKRTASAKAPAAAVVAPRPGRVGAVNRCRDKSGRTVYLGQPCANAGLEQIGILEGGGQPGTSSASASDSGGGESGGDRILWHDPRTGATREIHLGR